VLAFLERKWNLAAMTYRDANANDLTDFLDLDAMTKGQPTFPELPTLAAAGADAARLACSMTGPGTIPPPAMAPQPPAPIHLAIKYLGASRRHHGIVLELETDHGELGGLAVELHRGRHRLARVHLRRVGHEPHRVILRVHHRLPAAGRYRIVVRQGPHVLAHRKVRVRLPRKRS
jgi:hypothetical protein